MLVPLRLHISQRYRFVGSSPSKYGNFITDSSTTAGMAKNRTVLSCPLASLPVISYARKQKPCGLSALPSSPNIACFLLYAVWGWLTSSEKSPTHFSFYSFLLSPLNQGHQDSLIFLLSASYWKWKKSSLRQTVCVWTVCRVWKSRKTCLTVIGNGLRLWISWCLWAAANSTLSMSIATCVSFVILVVKSLVLPCRQNLPHILPTLSAHVLALQFAPSSIRLCSAVSLIKRISFFYLSLDLRTPCTGFIFTACTLFVIPWT